jgi:predicted amidohydrolase
LEAQQTIDAAGLIIAPGFIDLDSYAHPAPFSVRDGVTTALDIRRGTANVRQWYVEQVSVSRRYGLRFFKTYPLGVPSSDPALSLPESVLAV